MLQYLLALSLHVLTTVTSPIAALSHCYLLPNYHCRQFSLITIAHCLSPISLAPPVAPGADRLRVVRLHLLAQIVSELDCSLGSIVWHIRHLNAIIIVEFSFVDWA